MKRICSINFFVLLFWMQAHGQIFLHSETSSGDLSDDYLTPTILSLTEGISFLELSVQEFEPDLFTLSIPIGLQLDAIILRNYSSTSPSNQSFFGFQENRLNLSTFPSSGFLHSINFVLTGSDDLNLNVLPTMVSSNVALSAPIQAGDHAFWINETGIQSSMIFEFHSSQVIPIPEPSLALFLGLGALGIVARRKRPA